MIYPFVITLKWHFHNQPMPVENMLDRLQQGLYLEGADVIERYPNKVVFKNQFAKDILLRSNDDLMSIINQGSIEVIEEKKVVKSRIYCYQYLIIYLPMLLLVFFTQGSLMLTLIAAILYYCFFSVIAFFSPRRRFDSLITNLLTEEGWREEEDANN